MAQRLQVSERTIQAWLSGDIDPPWPEFQQMLDILLAYVEALAPG